MAAEARRVRLGTCDGGFVAWVMVPSSMPMPDVLLWGDRCFVQTIGYDQYKEVSMYVVPPPSF